LDKRDTSLRSLYGDGWSAEPVDEREFQVLTAVSQLGSKAGLDSVTGLLEDWSGRKTMVGVVFATLTRLETRGLIKVHRKPESRFEVSEQGERALRRAKAEGKQLVEAQRGLIGEEAPERDS
jgi:DNA-binding PadR family transcriptional regulator